MALKSIEEIVFHILNSLRSSAVFRNEADMAKGVLALVRVFQQNPDDVLTEIENQEYYKLWERIRDINLNNSPYSLPSRISNFPDSDEAMRLLCEAIIMLSELNQDTLPQIADIIINKLIGMGGKSSGLFGVDRNLARLIGFMANQIGMQDVTDPCSGLAQYVFTPEFNQLSFQGYEFNSELSEICNLRLLIHGRKPSVKTMDIFREYGEASYCDAVISIPPLYSPVREMPDYVRIESKYIHEYVIESFLKDSESKKAIVVLPFDFSFSEKSKWMRKDLIDSARIDMVIAMPSGMLSGTSISSLILVLDKEKLEKQEEDITFISLVDCVEKDTKGYGRVSLNFDKSKDLISNRCGQFVATVSMDEVEKNDFDLNPGRYLLDFAIPEVVENERIVKLSTFLDYVYPKYKTARLGDKKTVVGTKDLSEDFDIGNLTVKPSSEISSRYYEVDDNAIILGLSGSSFKLGLVEKSSTPVSISANLMALKSTNWIDIELPYILMELCKPYVSRQIQLITMSSFRFPLDYLFRLIRFVYRDYSEQKKMLEEARSEAIAKLQAGVSTLKFDFRKDVHMKRHAMGQTIQTIGNWWKVLETARSKGNLINEDAMVDGCDITLGEVLANIKSNIARVKVQIDKLDRGYKAVPVNIDLIEFVEAYMSTHRSPIFHYSQLDYENELNENGLNKPQYNILFPSEVLTMILNNVVSNACSHGFGDVASKANIIKMGIENVGGVYVLSISNNGKPCSPDMTPEQIIKYGESSDLKHHCGIGGYEINQLISDFGGALEIVLDDESEFPVEYRLTFKSLEK